MLEIPTKNERKDIHQWEWWLAIVLVVKFKIMDMTRRDRMRQDMMWYEYEYLGHDMIWYHHISWLAQKQTASCPTSLGSFTWFPPHLDTFVLSTMDSNHGFQALQMSLKSSASSGHQDTTSNKKSHGPKESYPSKKAHRVYPICWCFLEEPWRAWEKSWKNPVELFNSWLPCRWFLGLQVALTPLTLVTVTDSNALYTPRPWLSPVRRQTVSLPEGSRRIKNRCFAALFSLAKNSNRQLGRCWQSAISHHFTMEIQQTTPPSSSCPFFLGPLGNTHMWPERCNWNSD